MACRSRACLSAGPGIDAVRQVPGADDARAGRSPRANGPAVSAYSLTVASGAAAAVLGVGQGPGLVRPQIGRGVDPPAAVARRAILGQLHEAHPNPVAAPRMLDSRLLFVRHLIAQNG